MIKKMYYSWARRLYFFAIDDWTYEIDEKVLHRVSPYFDDFHAKIDRGCFSDYELLLIEALIKAFKYQREKNERNTYIE